MQFANLRSHSMDLNKTLGNGMPNWLKYYTAWDTSIFKNDYFLFHKKTAESALFVAIYVDDILVTGYDESEISDLKAYLDTAFKIKDLGFVNYFLGLEVLRSPQGLILTQRTSTLELLKEFDCGNYSGVITPLDYNFKLRADERDLYYLQVQKGNWEAQLSYPHKTLYWHLCTAPKSIYANSQDSTLSGCSPCPQIPQDASYIDCTSTL